MSKWGHLQWSKEYRLSQRTSDQLGRDLVKYRWFSIQCDKSVDSSSTAQLMVFIRMVFDDFSRKEELLTLLPLKTTTWGVDIYNAVKDFFVEKKALCAKVISFGHIMTAVVKLINSIRSRAKQHRALKVLLEEL
ncbi:hypothetical protein Q8A73_017357 [Channa argus]|nr:hypothetical protein Q8A73_017357 [Channa argus]